MLVRYCEGYTYYVLHFEKKNKNDSLAGKIFYTLWRTLNAEEKCRKGMRRMQTGCSPTPHLQLIAVKFPYISPEYNEKLCKVILLALNELTAPGNSYNKMEEGQLIQFNHFFLGKMDA